MLTIFIIGGWGFIGSHLTNYIKTNTNHKVVLIDNSKLDFYFEKRGSTIWEYRKSLLGIEHCFCYDSIETAVSVEGKPDVIVNLAATPIEVPLENANPDDLMNDIGVGFDAIQYAQKHDVYFLQMSSIFAYGDYDYTIDETANLNPKTPYGVSKATLDFLVINNLKNWNIVRTTNVFGFGDLNRRVTNIIPEKILNGEIVTINRKPLLDFIYVDDLVRGLYLVMMERDNEIYHISGGRAVGIEVIFDEFRKHIITEHKTNVVKYINKEDRTRRATLANDKARIRLKWEPKQSIMDSIRLYCNDINYYGFA